jgi:hypothetical protein
VLLLGNSFAPLIASFLLVVRFSHATTMQPFPIYWEEEFIGRLLKTGDLREIEIQNDKAWFQIWISQHL